MKIVRRLLLILHFMVGIGGMCGGGAAILNPRTPFGMPVDVLKNSPFQDYLIPGIILFTVVGLGNIFGGIMLLKKSKYQAYISGVIGGALAVFIIVQCIMIRAVAFMHILFFSFGAVEVLLAAVILFEQNQFPANIVIKMYQRLRNAESK